MVVFLQDIQLFLNILVKSDKYYEVFILMYFKNVL